MVSSSITTTAPASTGARHYPGLALLALFVFAPLFFAVVPDAELGAVTVYFLVLALLAVILYRAGIKPVDAAFPTALFFLAVVAKLLGATARYWMVVDLYDGASDAPLYHEHGQILAQYFKVFDFSVIGTYQVRAEGTTNLAHITGFLYTLLPVTMAGAFFFFAMLAFAGSAFYYRAVRLAWPEASGIYYRLCIFFLPSILFWPASLGKDAWLFFCSGLVVWGWVSALRKGNWLNLLWVVTGLLLINLIRPHVAAFLALGMGAGYLFYSTRGQRSLVSWVLGAVTVVVLMIYMVQSGAEFLKLESLSVDAVEMQMLRVQEMTTQGGSRFTPVSIFTPWGFVWGLITTLARPFPWEARSGQMLIAALETMGWIFLAWRQRRVLLGKVHNLRSDPITGFAFFYSLIYLLAMTTIGNFGILTRQRVLALPFIWMLFV